MVIQYLRAISLKTTLTFEGVHLDDYVRHFCRTFCLKQGELFGAQGNDTVYCSRACIFVYNPVHSRRPVP